MTTDTDLTEEQSQSGKSLSGLGRLLEEKRNAHSFSVAYVASQTLLNEDAIRALEEEKFDGLPSPVFVRGYIRTYAKLLGIDACCMWFLHAIATQKVQF